MCFQSVLFISCSVESATTVTFHGRDFMNDLIGFHLKES